MQSNITTDKQLPNNGELEQQVLSHLMNEDNMSIKRRFAFKLGADDFFDKFHENIYTEIISLIKSDLSTDLVSLSQRFADNVPYIMDVMNSIASTINFESRVTQLQTITAKRKALIHVKQLEEDLYKTDTPIDHIQEASMDLARVYHDYQPKKDFTTQETISEVNDIIKECANGTSNIFIPFGIPAIDCKLKLLRKQMMVLAAGSGIGKTALALSCTNKQIELPLKIGVFCGESSRHELMIRLISIYTNKPFMWYMEGMPDATEADMRLYVEAGNRLSKHADNLYIYGKGDYEHSYMGIRDAMTCLEGKFGQLDMIYVDYLQNMRAPKGMSNSSREEKVSTNIMEVNNILADFNVAGVVCSQLNREASKMKKPYMEQLKYASTIENEAHVITFLHRSKDALPNNGIMETEWYSDKTRVQQGIYAKLAFNCQRAEYTGLMPQTYKDVPRCADVPEYYNK